MKPVRVADVVAGIPYQCEDDLEAVTATSITADSREVQPGAIFVAVKGLSSDGHAFLDQAVSSGAVAVVVSQISASHDLGVPVVAVENTATVLGTLAATFYSNPAESMVMIGITGTNGKTTCSYLLETMIEEAGGKPGVIGTVNFRFAGNCRKASQFSGFLHQRVRMLRRLLSQPRVRSTTQRLAGKVLSSGASSGSGGSLRRRRCLICLM